MNSLATLIYPNTDIFQERYYPLFLLCTPMHVLLPVEPNPEDGDSEPDLFINHGLCQAHTPAPLTNNRSRFLRLIQDIKERKDDYAAQLSMLTMASMSAPTSNRSTEQRHEIVSSLLKSHALDHTPSDTELELWQARLILAIGEILDREEEELREQLNLIDKSELEMYRSLKGEGDPEAEQLFAEFERLQVQLAKPRLEEARKRFHAWLRLLRNQSMPEVNLWLATSPDHGDQIFNRYEALSPTPGVPLLQLVLPAHIMASPKHVIDQVQAFQQASTAIRTGMVDDIIRVSAIAPYRPEDPELLLPHGNDWTEQWEALLADHFPASRHGRVSLTIYLLVDRRIEAMFDLGQNPPRQSDGQVHGLLGVLDQQNITHSV